MSLFRNTVFNSIATFLNFISSFIASVLLARILGTSGYGTYSWLIWLISTVAAFLGFGFPNAVTKFLSEESGIRNQKGFSSVYSYALIVITYILIVLGFILLFFSKVLYTTFSEITPVRLFLIYLGVAFVVLTNLQLAVLNGKQQYGRVASLSVITSFATLFSVIIMWKIKSVIDATLIAKIFMGFFAVAGSVIFLKKGQNSTIYRQISSKQVWSYSLSVYLLLIINTIIWERSEIFFLNLFRSTQEVGFYSVAYSIPTMIMSLSVVSFTGVLFTRISQLYGENEQDKINSIYVSSNHFLSIISMPLMLGGIVLSHSIITVIYGNEYLPVVPIFQLLLIGNVIGSVARGNNSLLYGINLKRFIILSGIFLALLNISLDVLLIPRWGVIGAAVANTFTQLLYTVVGTGYICHIRRITFPLSKIARVGLASLVMGTFLFVIDHIYAIDGILPLALTILLGGFVYLIFLFLFRGIDINQLSYFFNRKTI